MDKSRRTVHLPDGGFINIAESTEGVDIDLVSKAREIFDSIAVRGELILFVYASTQEKRDNVVSYLREFEQFLPPQVRNALQKLPQPPSES